MEAKFKYKAVMLIDDVDLDNFVSETTLINYRFSETIIIQNDATLALDLLKKIKKNPGQPFPEVLFIDINMPVIDGFQFIENLTAEIAAFKPKLVMLTSSIYSGDRRKALESFKDIIFIVKPLTEETLKLI